MVSRTCPGARSPALGILDYMMIQLGFRDRASSGNTCIEKYTRNRRIGGKTCMGFSVNSQIAN